MRVASRRPVRRSRSRMNTDGQVMAESRSLLAMSYADPNRINTTFKAGEIWSLAKDGATGLDSKAKKKLWARLKKEVIYRDSPEDLEEKARTVERETALEYRSTKEYFERVAVDLASVKLRLTDEAAEVGYAPGSLFVAEQDSPPSDNEDDETPTRRDLLLARVLTEQRVMAQLRSGKTPEEPQGLSVDVRALVKEAALAKSLTMPPDEERMSEDESRRRKRRDQDEDEDDDRSRSRSRRHHHKHRRRRRDDEK